MTSTSTPPHTSQQQIVVEPLSADDLADADRVFRLAFGTMLGLPEPARFAEGSEPIRSRFRSASDGGFKAVVDGELVGSAFVNTWGSFAVFGPLTVRPDFWDRGVGSALWEARAHLFERRDIKHAGLFTAPQSTKHIHLYSKYGFWPRYLTALTEKAIVAPGAPVETIASLPAHEQERVIADATALTDGIFPGLDLANEIRTVTAHGIGDVVLTTDEQGLAGFAICHAGEGSESRPGTCLVKFAAARAGTHGARRLDGLLDACESFAALRALVRLEVSVNFARRNAYRLLAARGHRTFLQGVAMHRPDAPGFDRADAFVLDDWR